MTGEQNVSSRLLGDFPRRLLYAVFIGTPTLLMLCLMTAVYPVWRSTFWLADEQPRPPAGFWKEPWVEWWDEFIR